MTGTTPVVCEVDASGFWYNHWPKLCIFLNQEKIFDEDLVERKKLRFEFFCRESNQLTFLHHDKKFGENGIYDSSSDGSESCYIQIHDVLFDGVSIDHLLGNLELNAIWTAEQEQLMGKEFCDQYRSYRSNGTMSFNGTMTLNFDTPVYNWLTLSKYKVPMKETAYFSNYSARWHYEQDLELIEQIKKLIQ